jgi:hypothetical protein
LKVDKDAILTCSECGAEGPHELLYLSEHLCASRCISCGATHAFSGHIYAEYVRDLAERTSRLPGKLTGETFHPTGVVKWPFRALRKPFGPIKEVGQVTTFEQSRRSPASGRRIR